MNDKVQLSDEIKRKNRWKVIRTIIQIIFCCSILIWGVIRLCFPKKYIQSDKTKWNQKDGFIAISYTGVSPKETDTGLVSKKQLDSHLKALYEAGYITIGAEDIKNFYEKGCPLPDKALFLIFEDGRKDSMVFAESVLKKYNFKAMMLSYAYNVKNKDRLFLKKGDLKKLNEDSFWELGTNGYRFSYVNIKEKSNLKNKEESRIYDKKDFEYNHYLMDYIRDENDIPIETKKEMEERIAWDYSQMDRIYKEALGYLPETYMIMHANSVFKNMNSKVEKINFENIYKYFKLMFNREGSCYNTHKDSIYDLTRIQVKPEWSKERLLTEIKKCVDIPNS